MRVMPDSKRITLTGIYSVMTELLTHWQVVRSSVTVGGYWLAQPVYCNTLLGELYDN
jgi:hypothetical protein